MLQVGILYLSYYPPYLHWGHINLLSLLLSDGSTACGVNWPAYPSYLHSGVGDGFWSMTPPSFMSILTQVICCFIHLMCHFWHRYVIYWYTIHPLILSYAIYWFLHHLCQSWDRITVCMIHPFYLQILIQLPGVPQTSWKAKKSWNEGRMKVEWWIMMNNDE